MKIRKSTIHDCQSFRRCTMCVGHPKSIEPRQSTESISGYHFQLVAAQGEELENLEILKASILDGCDIIFMQLKLLQGIQAGEIFFCNRMQPIMCIIKVSCRLRNITGFYVSQIRALTVYSFR